VNDRFDLNEEFMMSRRVTAVVIVLSLLRQGVGTADEGPAVDELTVAITKSLPLLEQGAKGSLAQRKQCFNCHNQGLPIMALTAAQSRGFVIDQDHLQQQLQFTADFLTRNKDRYREGLGQGGQVDTAGYALWALDLGRWKPDETTAAVAEYFLQYQQDREYWEPQSNRPPSEQSLFTSTYVAVRALKVFGVPEQQSRIEARIDRVRQWVNTATPSDTEDRVFRLRVLQWISKSSCEREQAAMELLDSQRQDGGWGQTAEMASDAYATGTALVALSDSGSLQPNAISYRRGLRFLLSSQQEDGSWHVASHSKPIQTYFESGYPHGKDQFISMSAASWSTTALVLALPKRAD